MVKSSRGPEAENMSMSQEIEVTLEPVEPLPFRLERREFTPSVALVVPVFNEENVVRLTYERIAEVMDSVDLDWNLTFVNDGSRDGTIAELESLYELDPRVSYVALSRNFGHQAALAAGLDHSHADVVITMDADLQHPPELIPSLLDAWREGYDIVHTRKLSTDGLSPTRAIATRLAYRLVRTVAAVNIIPQASDYRLLDRDAVDALGRLPEQGRLYRGLAPWIGYRQAVVPFVADDRQAGSSQYGLRQLASLFARSFFDFSRAPLHVGLAVAGSAVAVCSLYLAYVLAAFLLGAATPSGFLSLMFAIGFLVSVNLFFLGIVGVYVARIYDEVRGRPTYIVSRVRERARAESRGRGTSFAELLPPLAEKLTYPEVLPRLAVESVQSVKNSS
jgi:dolichol-phosphate mannosyltransferase